MKTDVKARVAILGLSEDKTRYAYKAAEKLRHYGFRDVYGVNPAAQGEADLPILPRLDDLPQPVDTLTLYVGPTRSEKLAAEILKLRPRRIIFNPGAENQRLAHQAEKAGIEVVEGCTLVMLSTGLF